MLYDSKMMKSFQLSFALSESRPAALRVATFSAVLDS
jgi:hypothetical protein